MDLLLIIPSFDVEKFKGITRYSFKVYKRIKSRVDVEVLEIYKLTPNFLANHALNLFYSPLKQLLTKTKVTRSSIPALCYFFQVSSKLKNLKIIVTFHDLFLVEVYNPYLKRIAKLREIFTYKSSVKSNIIVAPSSQTAIEVEKVFKRKVDEKFKPKKVKKEKITLGFFANFSYRKRLDKAIEIFKILKQKYDVKLIIAGGYLKNYYQKQFEVKELTKGLKDIEILGYIPEEKIVYLYNYFDFYLFPSIEEGFSMPILEAQECGIPKEVTEKAIKCRDANNMAEKIIYLIESKEEYERIRKEGIKYAKKYLEIYESLIFG